jgi:hypothetical protein
MRLATPAGLDFLRGNNLLGSSNLEFRSVERKGFSDCVTNLKPDADPPPGLQKKWAGPAPTEADPAFENERDEDTQTGRRFATLSFKEGAAHG